MKVKIKHHKINRSTMLCAYLGYFDEDGSYCEVRCDEVILEKLPPETIEKVREGHDITIHIVPNYEVVVLAKNARDIDKYLEVQGAEHLMELLEALSMYNNPEDGSLWATYDFPIEI